MPLPMVHLSIAILLGERDVLFPSPDFLLGSIAPDAIHMRPNTARRDKHITHLLIPTDTPDHARVHDLLIQNSALPAFAAGYAAHVLVDRWWSNNIVQPFYDRVAALMDDAARTQLYYQETDQLDVNLFQRVPWRSQVWSLLAKAPAPDFPPWLTAAEIDAWRVRTLRWFDDPAHNPHITPQNLTNELLQRFIDAAIAQLVDQFARWEIPIRLV
jgi:hypothetical protein